MTITKMSLTSPILAGAAVLPVLWSLVRGEQPHPVQLVGAAVTIAGIVVISRPGPSGPGDELPATLKGVLLAVIGSACAGLLVVTLDYGAASDPFWAVMGVRCSAAIWAAVWVASVRPRLRLRGRRLPVLVLIGVMIATANTLFATATTLEDLSVVAVLGWLAPAVTILCARVVLHERLRPVQWAAAVTVLAGVVCLTLG
jgi:drug/metabolite transporter (DMT)-like permease